MRTRRRVLLCFWSRVDDQLWEGTCGAKWCLSTDGTPQDDGMYLCPGCGAELVTVKPSRGRR